MPRRFSVTVLDASLAQILFSLCVAVIFFLLYSPYNWELSYSSAIRTGTYDFSVGKKKWCQTTSWNDVSWSFPLYNPSICRSRNFLCTNVQVLPSNLTKKLHAPSQLTKNLKRSEQHLLLFISQFSRAGERFYPVWTRQQFQQKFFLLLKQEPLLYKYGNNCFYPLHAELRVDSIDVHKPVHFDAANSDEQQKKGDLASFFVKHQNSTSSKGKIQAFVQELSNDASESLPSVNPKTLEITPVDSPFFLPCRNDDNNDVVPSIFSKYFDSFTPLYFNNGTVVPAAIAMDFHEKRHRLTQLERLRDSNCLMCLSSWALAANYTVNEIKQLIVAVHTVQPHFLPLTDFSLSTNFLEKTRRRKGTRDQTATKSPLYRNETMHKAASTSLMAMSQNLTRLEACVYALETHLKRPPTLDEWIAKAKLPSIALLHSTLKTGYAALTSLVARSSPIVEHLARKYSKSSKDFPQEELLVAGLRAVQKGMRHPTTYPRGIPIAASTWVWAKSGILSFLYRHKSEIRIPPSWWSLRNRGKEIERKKEAALGRRIASEEVAQALGISASRWDRICRLTRPSVSTESPLKGGRSRPSADRPADTMGDLLISSEESMKVQQHGLETRLMQELLDILKTCLGERERDVICSHFGLFDGRLKTIEEIALHLRLSMADVRTLLRKATFKLRSHETQRALAPLNKEEKKQLKLKGHEALRQHVITHSLLQQLTRATLSSRATGMDAW